MPVPGSKGGGAGCGWVLQRYVEDPLLLLGRKFDLRLYLLLVVEEGPCEGDTPVAEAWVCRQGLARLCAER